MRIWLRRGPVACLLWPLSILFRVLAALRRALYAAGVLESVQLPLPVLVVGNILVGGTGKTPLTIWLVEMLRGAGYRPGVVSRGYGAADDTPRLVTPDATAREAGDEPLLIAARTGCPLAVGRDRAAAARLLLAAHPGIDVIVSDDGLQHYRLARDIEILLSDERGAGNGWMLPAGPLREPASRRADFVVINGSDTAPGAISMRLEGAFAEQLSDRSRRVGLASFADSGQRLAAAAGIGNPQRFFAMLRRAGLVFDALALPDHYDYAVNPFAGLRADIVLITEKDAVKCRHIEGIGNDPRLWVVPVTAHIDAGVAEQILEKLRGHTIA